MRDDQRGSVRNVLEDDRAGQTPVAALRHRDFCIYWSGSVVSLVGSQFTTVAMAWQIYELTNSPLELGLLGWPVALRCWPCCSLEDSWPTQ
jgi:hypothetical protein